MKEWKGLKNVKKVHDDLYSKSDPYDPDSDTYMMLIIKSVFSLENERTKQNAIWVQSVLEAIFVEQHLSLKIDTEVLGSWIETLTDEEHIVIIISKKFIRFFVKYLKYFIFTQIDDTDNETFYSPPDQCDADDDPVVETSKDVQQELSDNDNFTINY